MFTLHSFRRRLISFIKLFILVCSSYLNLVFFQWRYCEKMGTKKKYNIREKKPYHIQTYRLHCILKTCIDKNKFDFVMYRIDDIKVEKARHKMLNESFFHYSMFRSKTMLEKP